MSKNTFKILAIETSCDETAAALLEVKSEKLKVKKLDILSNIISSQVKLHAKYGGVYPELASREHIKNIIPVIRESLGISNFQFLISKQIPNSKFQTLTENCKLKIKNCFDYIAVTAGPGLIGSLLVGVNTAKAISYTLNKPIYPINHLEGHVYANFIGGNTKLPEFPLICLAVSGGHTSLIYIKNHLDFKIIGETLDDAAGEAFDKVAHLLNLGYPGGPVISQMADKLKCQNSNVKTTTKNLKLKFPRPMIDSSDFNFSFSGLKTSVLYTVKKLPKPLSIKTKAIICKEFQDAVVETLVEKTIRAAIKYKVKSILLGGGVASNSHLRDEFKLKIKTLKLKIGFFVSEKVLCTDNAVMIGIAAAYKIVFGKKPTPWYNVNADSNLKLITKK